MSNGAKWKGNRRRRRVVTAFLLLAVGLLLAFLARDALLLHAARWKLARTFDAQVTIGAAHVDTTRGFTFTDLIVYSGGTVTLRAFLPSVHCVVARPADWLTGRIAEVRSQGADVFFDLRHLDPERLPAWLTEASGRVGALTLDTCAVRVVSQTGSVKCSLDSLRATGSEFEAALRTVTADLPNGSGWSSELPVTVRGSFDAQRLPLRLTVPSIPLKLLIPTLTAVLGDDVTLAGGASVEVVVQSTADGPELLGSVTLEQASGSWAGKAVEWEGVTGSLDLQWQRVPDGDHLKGTLHADRGGVLFRGAYLDLGDLPCNAALSCQWEKRTKTLQLDDLSVALQGLVEVELTGEVTRGERPRARFEGELYLPALDQAGALVRSAFEGRSSLLSALKLGGWVEADLRLDLTSGRTDLEGHLDWRSGTLELGPIGLQGASLALPVRVVREEGRSVTPPDDGLPPYGLFVAEGVALGSVYASLAPVSLRLAGDELQFSGDERVLRLLDGEVVVSGLRCRRLWSGAPEFAAEVKVEDVSLARLTENAPVRLTGTVSAYFPAVLAVGDAFHTEGTATVDLFDGTVAVTELAGDNLAEPWWRLTFSARGEGLDLRQMTSTFGWGRASGLLAGSAQDMVISAGEPEQFEIELHNERASGVPQTLTVEVLDRLPIISAVAPMLRSAGVETLQYDALGLWCRLENDRLWVRGTAAEHMPQETTLPIPLLGPLLSALGRAFEGPEPEGEYFILGRSGLRPLNVVLEPVPEEGLDWPVIWRGLRAAAGERPDIEMR